MHERAQYLDSLKSAEREVVLRAIRQLRQFHTPEVVAALIETVIQKEDMIVATESAKVLAEFADPATTSALSEVLLSTTLEVEMEETAKRKAQIHDHSGLFALATEHGGKILELKMYAATGLLRIGTPQALQSIEEARKHEGPYKLNNRAIDVAVKFTSIQ